MSTTPGENEVYWPRVKEILDNCMERWKERWEREPYPGIHEYYWNSPEHLANSKPYRRQLIEPGVPGRDTNLVLFLRTGERTFPRMPRGGPYLSDEEIQEIIDWIDTGMLE